MINLLKKLDSVVLVIVLTIIIGIVVISLRSRTYSIGYEIASLKNKEKNLRQKKDELLSNFTSVQRNVRNSLLSEKEKGDVLKYTLPDQQHVIKEE